jgi:hypothetical protein
MGAMEPLTPEELATTYALRSPHDLHVPTLAEIFRREGIETLEQASAYVRARDEVGEMDAIHGSK